MSDSFGHREFTYTRDQVHQLVAFWKCNDKILSKSLRCANLIWRHPLDLEWSCFILELFERIAFLDAEGEPQDVSEDSVPDFWIIEGLYEP